MTITGEQLSEAAARIGLTIQHENGGYRVIEETKGRVICAFPNSNRSPAESKTACLGFILGISYQQRKERT